MKKIIHNIKTGEIQEVNLTAEEIAKAETDKQNYLAEKEAIKTAKAQKEADALAGNNKLLELGLTQAQVTAMTGYTPPAN